MLQEAIAEAEYRSGGSDGVELLLVTGTRGYHSFMRLMEDSLKIGDNVYATRSGNQVSLGANFNKYIFGNSSITITRNYALDYKNEADILDEDGYPLRSSKMFFIDRSKYEGEPNISVFHQNGLDMVINDIYGVGGKDGKSSGVVSSPVHGSKKIVIGTIGLKVLNPYSSIILEKVRI
jgi:hypothetical protein